MGALVTLLATGSLLATGYTSLFILLVLVFIGCREVGLFRWVLRIYLFIDLFVCWGIVEFMITLLVALAIEILKERTPGVGPS